MQSDYYRQEITAVLDAGPSGDEDFYRVKVFGKRDSKHLNISADQLRCLADVMDETNPPSLLPLANGHRVIMADVRANRDGSTMHTAQLEGVVLADTGEGERYVVWRVYLHKGECRWLAEHGDYSSDYDRAVQYYNARRGVTPTTN